MIRALYSAASGMTAQQLNVDNIAHNIANANTAGFKTRRAQFQDLLYQSMIQPGASASQQSTVPTGLQLGLGTRAASNEIIFTQGMPALTKNGILGDARPATAEHGRVYLDAMADFLAQWVQTQRAS